MLSHQPEVSRLIAREHAQRLADDAQHELRLGGRSALRRARALSGLPVQARAALNARHRRLHARA